MIGVAIITGIIILTLALVAPGVASPGSLALRPNSFVSILLMVIFIPIGLGLLAVVSVSSGNHVNTLLNDTMKNSNPAIPIFILVGLIVGVLIFVGVVCMAVRPTDGFLDAGIMTEGAGSGSGSGSGSEPDPVLDEYEARTCALMSRTDTFIAGTVGPKGMKTKPDGDTEDTPEHQEYVRQAQAAARVKVPGGALNCDTIGKVGQQTDKIARITTLEQTLRSLVGPTLTSTFDTSINSKMACEITPIPCADPKLITPEDKLTKKYDEQNIPWTKPNPIETALTCYESNILAPIDAYTDRMQKGQLKDCERKKAFASMK
jgi:hypothetical protein